MSSSKSITKSASIIGSATLLSRVLGMARDIIMASFFGTGLYAQAFFVAFRIPNLMRELVGEGATNSAFVPVLVEQLVKKGKDEFWKVANILLNFLLVVLSVFTIAGFVFAPQIVAATAPGFLSDAHKFAVTVQLTRVIVPYLILIGIAAYGMGVLNSLHHFLTPAIGPSLLNLSLILCMLAFKSNVAGLALGVLLGGALQILIQVYPLLKRGIHFREREFFHPAVKKIGMLLAPRTLGTGIYQINVIITQVLASFGMIVGSNAVAILWYSNRIMQLPLAMIGHAIAQASLPTLSAQAAKNDMDKLKSTVTFLLRVVFFALFPATVGLIALNEPIIRILFQRGAFTRADTILTADALALYAIGLVACGVIKILTNTYYSMQDTVTPVKLSVVSLAANIILNIMLMYPLKASGLALANSIAAITHAAVLYIFLTRKIGPVINRPELLAFLKMLIASVLMGAVCLITYRLLISSLGPAMQSCIIGLLGAIIVSLASYIFICWILNIKEIKQFASWILTRK